MSRGKYSVLAYVVRYDGYEFKYNCYGAQPAPWTQEMKDAGMVWNIRTMYGNYDEDGYDRYGYSCFNNEGWYVGDGKGVDRAGWTEFDYLTLADLPEEDRDAYYD